MRLVIRALHLLRTNQKQMTKSREEARSASVRNANSTAGVRLVIMLVIYNIICLITKSTPHKQDNSALVLLKAHQIERQ